MPAYRSSAEAEIRTAVVDRLRAIRPDARVMHEVNCSVFGPNRIDVVAVSRAEIISVEIKSAKDKLDRLPAQIASMSKMSHHVIAALHEKFLVECPRPTNEWAAHYERDGQLWRRDAPVEAKGADTWIFPEKRRALRGPEAGGFDGYWPWRRLDQALSIANIDSLDMLWAEELRHFCAMNGLATGRNATRVGMLPMIRWACTGAQITKGVCAILRARECVEADAPIREPGVAA